MSTIKSVSGEVITVTGQSTSTSPDQRVRLRPKSITKFVQDSAILSPLKDTNGFMFPYTPTINCSSSVNYGSQEIAHSIQDFKYFIRNQSPTFQLSGNFTCENNDTVKYTMACIHFLRSVSKMHFGGFNSSSTSSKTNSNSTISTVIDNATSTLSTLATTTTTSSDPLVGAPPAMLFLNGYGKFMFNNLPVILENFSFQLPENVDYVEFIVDGQNVWLPVILNISLNLTYQNTPSEARKFSYDDFRTGALLKKTKGGWF